MKRIKMNTGMSGLDFSWSPGQVVEVEDELADALCASTDGETARAEYCGHLEGAPRKQTATRKTTGAEKRA